MRTIVITGGTDGLGRGLALHYLQRGDRVIAVGSTQAKGDALATRADGIGAGRRLRFLRADLTSMRATRSLADTLAAAEPAIDALVLCAQRYRVFQPRVTTDEGYDHAFALGYLSRFLLSHALHAALEAAARPVVLNVGTPGVRLGRVHWDDPQLARRRSGAAAILQSFRANDLLAAGYADVHPGTRVSYVAYNPGVVATGMPDALPRPLRRPTRALLTLAGSSVTRAIRPMTALIDAPPPATFSAYWGDRRLSADRPSFDHAAAQRLHALTEPLISGSHC